MHGIGCVARRMGGPSRQGVAWHVRAAQGESESAREAQSVCCGPWLILMYVPPPVPFFAFFFFSFFSFFFFFLFSLAHVLYNNNNMCVRWVSAVYRMSDWFPEIIAS